MATEVADVFTILNLLTLDQLWSAYIGQASSEIEEDLDGLTDLANKMYVGISDAERIANDFRNFLEVQDDEFVGNALTATKQVVEEQQLGEWPFDGGFDGLNMRDWLTRACLFVQYEAGNEREVLAGKISQLGNHQIPDPDFTFRWKCALGFLAVGMVASAAALGGLVSGGPIGPVVAVLAGGGSLIQGTLKVVKTSDCTGEEVRNGVAATAR